jgi:hypothetical protein
MLRDQSSTLIFPSFHEGSVEGSGVSVDAGGMVRIRSRSY